MTKHGKYFISLTGTNYYAWLADVKIRLEKKGLKTYMKSRAKWTDDDDINDSYVLDKRNPKDRAEIRAQLLESLDQDRAAAMERCAGSAAAAKIRFDVLVRSDPLRVGDRVLLRRGQRLKFMSTWLGPYQIYRK
jgi:hypothetical protein